MTEKNPDFHATIFCPWCVKIGARGSADEETKGEDADYRKRTKSQRKTTPHCDDPIGEGKNTRRK
jgi:hypothetical protein